MTRPVIIIAVTALLSIAATATGQNRQQTTRPKAARTAQEASNRRDTLPPAFADSLMLAGYDKPLRSRRESLFVTNRTSWRLTRLRLVITYLDTDGRQLHEREVEAAADIPAGATRQITFPSWDRQLAFVYIHSEQPLRARAIPYSVKVKVAGATIAAE